MHNIKAKFAFGCIFSFVVFGLILVGTSDALNNPDSVVGAWLLDGDANDSSGNDYHGELTGAPKWISGKFGMAAELPGDADTIQITDFGNVMPTEEITIIAWARIDKIRNQDFFSFEPLHVGDQGRVTTHMPWDGKVHWQFGTPFTGIFPTADVSIDDSAVGEWNHWAFIHSLAGKYMAVYKNGEEALNQQAFKAFERGEANFHIGGRLGTHEEEHISFAGAIDDFAIFSAVLDGDEISALMNDGIMAHIGAGNGGTIAVEPAGKAATIWAKLKVLD